MRYKQTTFSSSADSLNSSIIIPIEMEIRSSVQFRMKDNSFVRVAVDIAGVSQTALVKALVVTEDKTDLFNVPELKVNVPHVYSGLAMYISSVEPLMFTGESAINIQRAFSNYPDTWWQAPLEKTTLEKVERDKAEKILASAVLQRTDAEFLPSALYARSEKVPFPKDSVVWHFLNCGKIKFDDHQLNFIHGRLRKLENMKFADYNLDTFLTKLNSGELVLDTRALYNKPNKRGEQSLIKQYRLLVESGAVDIGYFK